MDDHTYRNFTFIVLFESPTRKVHVSYHTFAEIDNPEKLIVDVSNAYKQHISRFKRVLYRGVLLKKPTVSIVKLSSVTNLPSVSGGVQQLLIQNKVDDPTLTSAIRDPTVLCNVDRDAFCQEYKAIFAEDGEPVAQTALLIHQVNDPTASKVVGMAGSVFSVTLALLGAFVF
ncbi:uncharacterized protein FIESC28_01063 [Fusarium coffeatum]|uniref:Uncharacterized protein n=1 Tax=Fusarium coffeatum TaxID=231269 RepID=A0A366SB40_9HYPO|nr:uncharacterized protein FIESC28_01063 [Fusarium coffeatum]RBR26172.1 hypothetical protein FIESC28_01063 [Fusarium coffeatum]